MLSPVYRAGVALFGVPKSYISEADVLVFVKFERLFELNAKNSTAYKYDVRPLLATVDKHFDFIESALKFWTGKTYFAR